MPADLLGYAYAATVAAGGILGYVKAGSVPSLAAGLTFGAILGYGALLTSQDPPRPLLQVGTSLVLAGIMGARWSRSGKFMPPGIVCVLSCAILARGLLLHHRFLPLIGKSD
ncbi:transmembrane protein 14 homolog [Toxorhynchites rutilus septentrionalis]|uniref:transmembrane protein 14 homolog n=1 Tax=Toxorhynchites rutilus septentrionalis TaxID=329112 RepID=UPI00247A293D|nr:transmembrane protein 14 homolog [Toxorhynchites rutilus septentrionalis]